MRIGIFGGSFDPVHLGHLRLADCCQQQAALDQVWFTPAAVQPLKQNGPLATNQDRQNMLLLALDGHPNWRLCRQETDRGGISYTVETLRTITAENPTATCFLLMGADTLRWLPDWKSPQEVCRLATPLVVHRAGEPGPDFSLLANWVPEEQLQAIQQNQVDMPPMAISSSQIREQVSQGHSLEKLVPKQVAQYIAQHRLYQNDTER